MDDQPLPSKENEEEEDVGTMTFYRALHRLMEGKSITKEEWGNPNIILKFNEDTLQIRNSDGTWHDLILRTIDVQGKDWKCV